MPILDSSSLRKSTSSPELTPHLPTPDGPLGAPPAGTVDGPQQEVKQQVSSTLQSAPCDGVVNGEGPTSVGTKGSSSNIISKMSEGDTGSVNTRGSDTSVVGKVTSAGPPHNMSNLRRGSDTTLSKVSEGPGDLERSTPINIPKPDALAMAKPRALTSAGPTWASAEDVTDAAPRRSRANTSERQRHASVTAPPSVTTTPLTPRRTPIPLDSMMSPASKDNSQAHVGMSPSFIFLQLYHSNLLGSGEQRPVVLPSENQVTIEACFIYFNLMQGSRRNLKMLMKKNIIFSCPDTITLITLAKTLIVANPGCLPWTSQANNYRPNRKSSLTAPLLRVLGSVTAPSFLAYSQSSGSPFCSR